MYKAQCSNCAETSKGRCKPSEPLCKLSTKIIEQLILPQKICAFAETLQNLRMKVTIIGDDFLIESMDTES